MSTRIVTDAHTARHLVRPNDQGRYSSLLEERVLDVMASVGNHMARTGNAEFCAHLSSDPTMVPVTIPWAEPAVFFGCATCAAAVRMAKFEWAPGGDRCDLCLGDFPNGDRHAMAAVVDRFVVLLALCQRCTPGRLVLAEEGQCC